MKTMIAFVLMSFSAVAEFGSDLSVGIQSLPASPDLAAMGGLNICIPTTVGINPAQNGLMGEAQFQKSVYGEGYLLGFSKGPNLAIGAANASALLGKGSLKLNYYQVKTVSSGSKTIMDPDSFEAESWELSYGFKLKDNLAIGFSFPYSESSASSKMGSLKLGSGKSRTEFATTAGVFWRVTEKINLAGTWNISSEKNSETELWSTTKTRTLTSAIRLGVSVQPWLGATLGMEVLNVSIKKPGQDENTVKLFFGAEQYLNKHFCLRAGCLNGGLTAGFGLVWGKKDNVWLDVAYMANPVVMDQYWGNSQGIQASLCVAF
jgi:hypothetical protein